MKRSSLLAFLLSTIIVVNILLTLIPRLEMYTKSDYWLRYPSLKKMYYDSIYANKKGEFIPDQYVYSFAAGSLIQGVSPILVNPETPPLGKYFIALSIIFFNNEHIFTLLFGLASFVLLYLIGRQVFASTIIALLPVLLISFEPLMLNQLIISPLLDIIQLFFLLAFFYFFNKAEMTKKYIPYYVLASSMVGGFISTKFFGTGVTLVAAGLIVLLARRQVKRATRFSMALIIAPLLLLSMYVQVFFSGYSFRQFLGIQKWILAYNQGHLTKLFTFFPLFLLNIWYSWWDSSVMSDSQWQITWPLSFITFIVVIILYLRNSRFRNKSLDIVLIWTILYVLILQTGYTSARYFVLLLPPLFIIMIYCFQTCTKVFLGRKK